MQTSVSDPAPQTGPTATATGSRHPGPEVQPPSAGAKPWVPGPGAEAAADVVDGELQSALDALQMASSDDLKGVLVAAQDVHRRLRARLGDVTDP